MKIARHAAMNKRNDLPTRTPAIRIAHRFGLGLAEIMTFHDA
ncbi:MAG: hypothetical protein ACK47S_05380 [Paracoccaceae bacterium]